MESGAKDRTTAADRQLAEVLKHPLRARIVAELEERQMSPAEIAAALDEPLPRTRYHYDVLTAVGMVAAAEADPEDAS